LGQGSGAGLLGTALTSWEEAEHPSNIKRAGMKWCIQNHPETLGLDLRFPNESNTEIERTLLLHPLLALDAFLLLQQEL